jgi:hypothetical protein
MAISKAYINGSASALAEFLESSGLFGSVTYSGSTVTCKDDNENTVCIISDVGGSLTSTSITVYYDGGESSASGGNTWSQNYTHISYAYKCANGVIIQIANGSDTEIACILLTKTNRGKICTVFSYQSSTDASRYTTFHCISFDDVAPISTITLAANQKNQTSVTSFLSNNDLNASSYTPDAGFVLFGQNYTMGYGSLTMGGEIWLTNGYWAVRDGAAS